MVHEAETPRWVSGLEASLLVLATYFLGSALLGWWLGSADKPAAWLALSLAPVLILLAGAIVVRTVRAPTCPLAAPRLPLLVLSFGLLLVGGAGGVWIGPTLPQRLAPVLSPAAQIAWAFAWVGVGAPVIEELFFRGTLQPALARHIRADWSVFLTALAFALAHVGMPLSVAFFIFIVGLAAGFAAFDSGYVLPAIGLHMGWNLGTIGSSLDLGNFDGLTLAIIGTVTALVARGLHRQAGGPW